MKDTRIVELDQVKPNQYKPRREFDDEDLMDMDKSIRAHG